jgi:hypothetical protein
MTAQDIAACLSLTVGAVRDLLRGAADGSEMPAGCAGTDSEVAR